MIGTKTPVDEERTRFGDHDLSTASGRPSGETLVTTVEHRQRT
jgi:hypothetical protein